MDDTKPGEISLLPPNTRDFVYNAGPEITWTVPGDDEQECEGAAFHSPRPLFVRNTPLALAAWFPEGPVPSHVAVHRAPAANLCGTCRDNLSILLQMLHATDGDLPWAVRREFGNALRALAVRGWAWFEATHRKEKS